jgi:hypothetical protein
MHVCRCIYDTRAHHTHRFSEIVSQALGKGPKKLGVDPTTMPLQMYKDLQKALKVHEIVPVLESPLVCVCMCVCVCMYKVHEIVPVLESPLVCVCVCVCVCMYV